MISHVSCILISHALVKNAGGEVAEAEAERHRAAATAAKESWKSPSRTFKAWIIWRFLNWRGKQTYQVPFEECVYMCKTFSHHINFFIRRHSEHQEFYNWWKLKINLSIRWNNFLLLESGVHGKQPITNGRFSLRCSWAKATSQKKKSHRSSLKKISPV